MKRFAEQTETEIYEFLLKYGEQNNDEFYLSIPHSEKIIIDGRRFAEEYEDLPNDAPCQIDGIKCDISYTNAVAFHMHTAFTTHYPLMSNDWYNFGPLPQKAKNEIISYLKCIESKLTVNKKYSKNAIRKKWLTLAETLLEKSNLFPSLEYKGLLYEPKVETGNLAYSGFLHSFDCDFCCDNETASEDRIEFILKEWEKVFSRTDVQISYLMTYPSLSYLKDKLYLSYQNTQRYTLQNLFIKRLLKPLYKKYNVNFINWLIEQDPEKVTIIKGDTFELRNIDKSEWFKLSAIPEKFERLSQKNDSFIRNKSELQFDAPYILEDYYDVCKKRPDNVKQRKVIFRKIEPTTLKYEKKSFEQFSSSSLFSFKDFLKTIDSSAIIRCNITFEDVDTKEVFTEEFVYDSWCVVNEKLIYPIKKYKYYDNTIEITEIFDNFIDKEKEKYNTFFKYAMLSKQKSTDKKIQMIDIDGIKISKTNIIANENQYGEAKTHKKLFNFADIIPKGYRLPTRKEIMTILEKHPFDTNNIFDTKTAKNDVGLTLKGSKSSIYIGWNTSLPYIAVDDYWLDEKEKYTSNVIRAVSIYGKEVSINASREDFLIYLVKCNRNELLNAKKDLKSFEDEFNIDTFGKLIGFNFDEIATVNYTISGKRKYTLSSKYKYRELIDVINKTFNTNIDHPKYIHVTLDDFSYTETNDLINYDQLLTMIWLYLYSNEVSRLYSGSLLKSDDKLYEFHKNIAHKERWESLASLPITSLEFVLRDGSVHKINKNDIGKEYYYYLQKFIL